MSPLLGYTRPFLLYPPLTIYILSDLCINFLFSACFRHIELPVLIPKLNEQDLLTAEEEKKIINLTCNKKEQIAILLKCVGGTEDGGIKFLTALKAETSHDGHTNLLRVLPSIEGTHALTCIH